MTDRTNQSSQLPTECVDCGGACHPEGLEDWADYGVVPCVCASCQTTFWATITHDRVVLPQPFMGQHIPPLPCGVLVAVRNAGHPLHDKTGEVIAKKHLHYHLRMEDGRRVWVPAHWVIELTKDTE